ncbi:protein toll-like [Mytilus edulis]|uniref:protein toll-like n=1 Tax=Mytilus edulis TaxID=6550 RepID=UPI0039EFA5A3
MFNHFFSLLFIAQCIQNLKTETWEKWIPPFINRTDLLCPSDHCTRDPALYVTTKNDCCTCWAEPSWKLYSLTYDLVLEYTRRGGTAQLIGDTTVANARFVHSKGFLSKLPNNVCEFVNLIEIEATNNKISSIGNISCLHILDTLDLSHNSIDSIGKDTFKHLPLLRVLRLTHNGITTVEPYALAGTTMSIFLADLSFNNMTEIDMSILIPENRFCQYDFSSNNIVKIVNEQNFKIDVDKIYHGGFVNLNSNDITQWFDFKDLGIDDISILGKVMQFGFSLQNMKWTCDCRMEPFLELSQDTLKRIWRDYYNVTCWDPPEYRGVSITDFFMEEDKLHLLVCNKSSADKCPKECYCFYQPKNRRTVVNCTGVGLLELPTYVPEGDNLTLLFDENDITKLEYREYFNRSSVIRLSNNKLNTISSNAIESIDSNAVFDLSDNNMNELPRDFQSFDPCITKLGKIKISCGCGDQWLVDWVKNKRAEKCKNTTEIICFIGDEYVSTIDLDLGNFCNDDSNLIFLNILFGILIALLLGVFGVLYTFRYELFILKRRFINQKSTKIYPLFKYDVLISFDDNDAELRSWVMQKLASYLKGACYKTFIPCRDGKFGDIREEALINNINSCKNYIVILCDKYHTEDTFWTTVEWKYIWHSFKQNKERQIIIINYHQLESSEIREEKLKAFIRVGTDIDFSNRKHHLFKDIHERLGSPILTNNGLKCANIKFTAKSLHSQEMFMLDI